MIPVVISRHGRSQGLLYKQPCNSLIKSVSQSVSHPFPPTALQRSHTQTVRDSSSSYKIDFVILIKNFLNSEGHQHPLGGSKVLLTGWIWPIGGASASASAGGRVCPAACAAGLLCNISKKLCYSGILLLPRHTYFYF